MKLQHQNKNNNKQPLYQFCYIQDDPYSLTITKQPKLIYDSLYKQANYLWVTYDTQQLQYQFQQIEQKAEVKINFLKTFQYLLSQYELQNNVVLICHRSLIDEVETFLAPMISSQKIKCIIFYGYHRIINKKLRDQLSFINVAYVDSQQAAIRQLKQDKKYYTTGDFVNFISLDKQKCNSNFLVKTMFAMINQITNVQQIMQKFKELAIMSFGEEHQPDIQQLVQQYQKNNQLQGNKAVYWWARQSFLYRFVNRILRISKDPTCLFIIQPYFKDLFNNVQRIYREQMEKNANQQENDIKSYKQFTCYRGGQISENQIKFFKQNRNSFIQNLGFMSTSRYEYVAKTFSTNAFFVIQVDDSPRKPQLDYGFADLIEHNPNGENQIIFNPLNSFQIVGFQQCQKQKYKYKITLKYGQMARVTANQKQELRQKQLHLRNLGLYQLRESEKCKSIRHVLIQQNYKLDGIEQYCDKFMEIAYNSKNLVTIGYAHCMKGSIADKKGDYKSMEIQYTKSLEILKSKLSYGSEQQQKQNQLKITKIINNLGLCSNSLGQYKKAVEYLQKSQKFIRQTLGENHIDYAIVLNNLAYSFDKIGQQKKAIECLEKCQKIKKQLLGQNNPDYARTVDSLGNCYMNMSQYQKAVEYFQRCEKIRRQNLGENHLDYSTVLNNLGFSFTSLGQYEKAIQYYKRSEKIYRETLGEKHLDYANILNNIGILYYKIGKYQQAVNYFQRCLHIQRQSLGENHPNYREKLINLGLSFCNLYQYQKAKEYFQRYEQLSRQKIEKNHPDSQNILNNQKFIYSKVCEFLKSSSLWNKNRNNQIIEKKSQINQNKMHRIEDIKADIEKEEQKQEQEQTNLQYYLDICKECVSQIQKIDTSSLFQFQLYNEVMIYIEDFDMRAARTAFQIIIGLQKDNQQLQSGIYLPIMKALEGLNNLFMILLDIYDPEKARFSQRFHQCHMKLKELQKEEEKGKK